MDLDNLKPIIESLLFVSGEPMALSRLAKLTDSHRAEIENAVMALEAEYSAQKRGMTIIRKEDEVQMATNPDYSNFVSKLLETELQESLSQAALEVASIIAYRGPITRSDIEAIRGVNCTYTIRNLLMRGLVERSDNPKDNRGYLYRISFDFLKALGIGNARDLPDFEDLSRDKRAETIIENN